MSDEQKANDSQDEVKPRQAAEKEKTCDQTSCCKGKCCDVTSQGCGDCVNCE